MVDSNPLKHTNQISFLYVDDEEELLTIAKLFLERTGEFRVDIAKSAQEVLQSGSLQSYDAIISDYQMPGMNGIEFLKAVRDQDKDIPFILFTGKGREEVVIEAINNGADFYLQKGGDPKSQFAELSHKIKQAVRRKRAERSFQDSQKELGDIIDFLPDPTFVIDKSGTIISWNHAIEKMTGHSARKMLGKGNYEYAIPLYGHRRPILIDLINETDETLSRYYTHISRSGDAVQAEVEYVNEKGRKISLYGKACPLYSTNGEITGSIESLREITELKNYAEKLQNSEKKYRNLIEFSRDAIIIIGFDGTIYFYNTSGALLLEEESLDDTFARKNIMEYVHPDSCEDVLKDIELFKQGNDANISQYKLITTKNHEIWVESHGRKIPFHDLPAIFITLRDITQRKQIEEERDTFLQSLISQQKFTETLLDAIPLPVFWKDTNFRILGCNQAYCRLLGISSEQLLGKAIHEIWPDSKDAIETMLHDQKLIKNERNHSSQRKLIDVTGKTHDVIVSKNLFFDHSGKIAGIVGSIQDITDYNLLLQNLKRREELFRMIVTQSSDIFVIISPTYEITYISPNHSNLTGFLTEEATGTIERFIHPDDYREVIFHIDNLANNISSIETAEFRTLKRDGSYILLEGVGVNCIDNPAIKGILITARDITTRKRTEQELSRITRLFQKISENSPVFIALLDEEGFIVLANQAFSLPTFNYDNEKTRFRIQDFFKAEWEIECSAILEDVIQLEKPCVHECPIVGKCGDKILSTAFFPIQEEDKTYIGFIGLDITEQKILISQLNESIIQNEALEKVVETRTREISYLLELKNSLITAIAHDLRTPLTPLIALLPVLEHEDDCSKQTQIIRILEKNTIRIASIVENLLFLNKLGSINSIEDISDLNVHGLIENLLNVHSITAEKKKITIITEIPTNIVIKTSLPHLTSVLDNVISNAVKYSKQDGKIWILVCERAEKVRIQVLDNGIGLTNHELSHVFEPFFKADPSRHDRSSSGLGLSVSKQLLQAIGGRITICSEGLDKGTHVTIWMKKSIELPK